MTRISCPHCPKSFLDQNGLWMHAKAKHGKGAAKALRPVRDDDEPSMGSLVIEAQMNRLMGVPNPEWIETMFGDVLEDHP